MAEKKKPQYVTVRFLGMDNSVVPLTVLRFTKMKLVMRQYCHQVGLQYEGTCFRLDGVAVIEYDTPDGLKLDESDVIEVYQRQMGGAPLM